MSFGFYAFQGLAAAGVEDPDMRACLCSMISEELGIMTLRHVMHVAVTRENVMRIAAKWKMTLAARDIDALLCVCEAIRYALGQLDQEKIRGIDVGQCMMDRIWKTKQ